MTASGMPEGERRVAADGDMRRLPPRRPMRRHQRDVFHADIVDGAAFAGPMDLALMEPVRLDLAEDVRLVPFSRAMQASCTDFGAFVDFYEDDFRFERLWNHTERYLARLSRFAGVIEPDYSTCLDFPVALKGWNMYRNQALGSYLQRQGLLCVPNVRCEPGLSWMLDGTPRGSVVAVGARSAVRRPKDRAALMRSVRLAFERLRPTGVIWYGSTAYGIDEWLRTLGIPVRVVPGRMRG